MADDSAVDGIVTWTSLVGALVAATFAFLIWRANPRGRRNRHLALLMLAEAAFQAALASTARISDSALGTIVPWFALTLISIAFLLFATTLEGRIAKALSNRLTRVLLVGICLAVLTASLAQARALLAAGGTPAQLDAQFGWPWPLFAAASVVSLVISVNAYASTAPGTPTRRKAGAYALAFGLRDALYAGVVIWWAFAAFVLRSPLAADASAIVSGLTTLIFVAFLAYGILSTQLFDIDLRIKWGISRGSVASFALAVVFVISKVVEVYASRTLGFVAGAVAAGLLMFAAPRLNKLGEKVANTAMPNVQPTSQYVAYKKLEVYRAAVESALEGDAKINDAERAMLDRLRVKLGLPELDAQALEAELSAAST